MDLSDVAIRAVSPVHLQYLTNMGVRASMSVAIHVAGRLWGLIACHHLTEPLRPPVRTRNAVDLVGRTTSTVLAALLASESAAIRVDLLERLDALTEPMRLDGELDPGEALAAAGDQLPALLDAGGAAVVAGGTAMLAGTCPPVDLVHEVTSHATAADLDLLESDQLSLIDERWAAHADTAAGALAVRVGSGDQWLIWFRPETATEIRWGGDPNKTDAVLGLRGQSQLNPRASFAEYLEHVHGTSAPWSGEQVSAARQAAARLAALNAARLQRDAGIAAALQRAVLIEAFPPTPGVDGAARYLPSGRDPIGGDGYHDFFRHEGGPVVAVGDVAGHGLSVAPAMAQLRHALRGSHP